MIGLTSEITDEVSSADGTTIYISVDRWSKRDKVPCLRVQAGKWTHFFRMTVQRSSH